MKGGGGRGGRGKEELKSEEQNLGFDFSYISRFSDRGRYYKKEFVALAPKSAQPFLCTLSLKQFSKFN